MHKKIKDGSTLYDHGKQVERATGRLPEEFQPIPPPEGTEHILEIFWDLRSRQHSGFSGPEPLTYSELDAWQRVRRVQLPDVLIDIILQLDDCYIDQYYKDQK